MVRKAQRMKAFAAKPDTPETTWRRIEPALTGYPPGYTHMP